MKIAYLDIETSPMLGWVWGKYQQDILSFEKDFFVMCLAVRWNDSKKIEVYSLPDFKTYEKDHEDDSELMNKAWEILDEADIVVAHNGDRTKTASYKRYQCQNCGAWSRGKRIESSEIK